MSRVLNKRGADGMDNFKVIKFMIIDFFVVLLTELTQTNEFFFLLWMLLSLI